MNYFLPLIFILVAGGHAMASGGGHQSRMHSIPGPGDSLLVEEEFALQNDTLIMTDSLLMAVFDSTAALKEYTHTSGFGLWYPVSWQRDFRVGDNLLLRMEEEGRQAEGSLSFLIGPAEYALGIGEYADMLIDINKETWEKYMVSYTVLERKKLDLDGSRAMLVLAALSGARKLKLTLITFYDEDLLQIEYLADETVFAHYLPDVFRALNTFRWIED